MEKDAAALKEQLSQVTLEGNKFWQARDALILETTCTSVGTGAVTKDRYTLKPDVGKVREPIKGRSSTWRQLNVITLEREEPKEGRHSLILEYCLK
jgi:hypothetical protein